MKKYLLVVLWLFLASSGQTQITTPQIKASFGVDADLRANYFDGFIVNGNDDWFNNIAGTGKHVIDTTGASFIMKQYTAQPATRMQPFFRGMKFPQYSVINGKLWLDAIFIRDHHGDDSTVFASGSNKNGMSPGVWSCPVSQGIPDKNDILDIMMHVRRDGPNVTDSLWMFGGVSIDNTTGNRYFDFEMYQTDIVYNRLTRTFMGFGADAGHTAWQFDASGNILKAGDIIFTAEYSSSQLSLLEARIWVANTSLSITPTAFNWGGAFDGASSGSTYGYANITPKTAGAFYTGLQCSNNTWAGPFGVVLQNNALAANYSAKQFMEFSVNLSKLGLDPLATMNNACGLPFRRILVKSRASTSFTAELKDFVGPFSFFRAPAAQASADIPVFCGSSGISNICVDSAISTSLYTWSTTNGNIVGDSVGPCITVDQPGTYIVRQQLMDSCGISYATDTVVINADPTCVILKSNLVAWGGSLQNNQVRLGWSLVNQYSYKTIILERSTDKNNFQPVASWPASSSGTDYSFIDRLNGLENGNVYYRLRLIGQNNTVQVSKILSFFPTDKTMAGLTISPNPVNSYFHLTIQLSQDQTVLMEIVDMSGRVQQRRMIPAKAGLNRLEVNNLESLENGVYVVRVQDLEKRFTSKIIVLK